MINYFPVPLQQFFVVLALAPCIAHAAALPQTIIHHDFFLKINNGDLQKINFQSSALHASSHEIKTTPQQKVSEISLRTPSGIHVPVRFYDRGSNVVIIMGQGLPAPKESMDIHAGIFASYNIVLFDYRWNGSYEKSLIKSILMGCPVQKILLNEEEEVQTVIDFVKSNKNYLRIVGLGECYSTFLFAKIQAQATTKGEKGPFTHLIFDSCWYSLRSLAEQICADPWLPLSPQTGGAPWIIKAITNNCLGKRIFLRCMFALVTNISVEPYLASLHIPVLFIHGRKDLFVPEKHFNKIWQATTPSSRALLSTPYRHSSNLHNKIVYRCISEQFVWCSSMQEFEQQSARLLCKT